MARRLDRRMASQRALASRVVLSDGRQILVEVKNVAPSGINRKPRLRPRDVNAGRSMHDLQVPHCNMRASGVAQALDVRKLIRP